MPLPKILRLVYRNIIVNTDPGSALFIIGLPSLYLVFFGYGYQSFLQANASYLEFLAPGILAFQTLIAGTVAGSMLWADRRWGMLGQLLVGPFTRLEYLLGIILTSIILGLIGSAIMLALTLLLVSHGFSALGLSIMIAGILIGSVLYGSVILLISSLIKSQNTYNTVQIGIIFVSNFASTVFYPYSSSLPLALRILFLMNPLTYISNVVRDGYLNSYGFSDIVQLVGTLIFTLGVLFLSARAYFRSDIATR